MNANKENTILNYSKPKLVVSSIAGLASTKMPPPSCEENRICMDDLDCFGGTCNIIGPAAGFCTCDEAMSRATSRSVRGK